MPFGLSNAGATFQKAMDMAFGNLMYKFVVVYLDDFTVYSKKAANHIGHLRHIFERCWEFEISLNPNKCVFSAHEGNFVSKGVTVDLERVATILELPLPHHKKGLLSSVNIVQPIGCCHW